MIPFILLALRDLSASVWSWCARGPGDKHGCGGEGGWEGLHAEAHGKRGRLGLAAAGVGTLLRGLNCLRKNLGQRAQIGGRRHVLLLLRRLQLLLERV